jgi:ATP-dependent RNA helicase DOB1
MVQQIALLENKISSLPLSASAALPKLYDLYDRKQVAIEHVKSLKRKLNSVHDILHLEELKSRKRVLRRLGFTTADDVVEMKGRVACEISTGDELMLTEMMFGGVFNPLLPEHCAALLACFIFDEKVGLCSKVKD